MGHVYARLTGHGLALVPCWPYTFERPDAESEAVVVTNWREDGPAKALVDPSDAHTLPGIVDVGPGPDHPFWVIETTTFKAAWPAGFRVESTLDPFHLVGEHDASIYVQGPAQLAGPDAMVGPGQTVVARRTVGGRGVQAIELAYEHEGEPWWQAHYLYRRPDGVLVFTAQSRVPGVAAARSGVEWMMGLD